MKEHIFTSVNVILIDQKYKRREAPLNANRNWEVQPIVGQLYRPLPDRM
jgi:hypothetical protein